MVVLIVLFGASLAAGLFFLTADLLRLPYLKTSKAMINTGREKKTAAKTAETYLLTVAVKLAPYIRKDEYKKGRLKNILKASGLNMEPEVFQEINRADELLAAKRGTIESELPRFVSTIEQELKNSRDILSIVEKYKKNAGEQFAGELDILVADMRSSSYEAALTRFEARLNSPMLSDVVRGLISVLRGDDGAMYFQMLAHDFKQMELQRLKKEAQKIPPKIRVFSFVMLMCFLATYLVIIVMEIIKSMGTMF